MSPYGPRPHTECWRFYPPAAIIDPPIHGDNRYTINATFITKLDAGKMVDFFSTGNKQKLKLQLINLYWLLSVANLKKKNELSKNISDPLSFIAASFGVHQYILLNMVLDQR